MASLSLGDLLTAIAGSATQPSAISALVNGIGGIFNPDPAIALVQQDLLQLQIALGDSKAVVRVATLIQSQAGDLTTVGMVAGQLASIADQPAPDQNAINRGAAALAAVISAAANGSGNMAAFNFLVPTITAAIAAKPAA